MLKVHHRQKVENTLLFFYRARFIFILAKMGSKQLWSSTPIHALWSLNLKQNDAERLLLVLSDLSNSLIKALQYGQIVCRSHRYTTNILTTETAIGNQSVTPY